MGERAFRLSGVGAFEAVFDRGRRVEGRLVQLVLAPAALSHGRAGFVIGRKHLRLAVDRNRFKRLVRQHLRQSRPRLCNVDLIVRIRKPLPRDRVDDAAAEAVALLSAVAAGSP